MQNKIQFAGKHSRFTVRDLYSLIAPIEFHCKSFTIVKGTAKNAKGFHHEQFAIYSIRVIIRYMVKNNSKWNCFGRASLCYMFATEYLWMSTCEYITIDGLLSTCAPTFRSDLEITALPHTKTSFSLFNIIDTKMTLFLKPHFLKHNPSVILIVYFFVNYYKIMLH